jgi:hypothetical protein
MDQSFIMSSCLLFTDLITPWSFHYHRNSRASREPSFIGLADTEDECVLENRQNQQGQFVVVV